MPRLLFVVIMEIALIASLVFAPAPIVPANPDFDAECQAACVF